MTAAPNQQQTDSTVGGATHEPTPGNMVGRNVLKFLGYGFLLCFLLLLIGGPEAESVFRVRTGWIWFLASSQQQMNAPGAESGLFVGFLISAIVYGCISNFGISKCGAAGGSGWRRRIRRSAAIVGGVVLIFVAGTAFVGLTKNVIWLAKAKGSLVEGGGWRRNARSREAISSRLGLRSRIITTLLSGFLRAARSTTKDKVSMVGSLGFCRSWTAAICMQKLI